MPDAQPEDSTAQADLDALLDDALNDFEPDQPAETSASASNSAPVSEPPRQSKGKGLAFDPLPKPRGKKAHLPGPKAAPGAGLFDAFGGGFGAIPPDIADQDKLSAGFQRMMAELAQVDLSQGQPAPPPMQQPAVPGDHDLAATLQALAANSTSFGAAANPQQGPADLDGIDSDMLKKLSEQLNALGAEAAGMPGGVPGGGPQDPPPEEMSGLVDGLMHQLLAKDVLYQPIQEIGARYPQWLEQHRQTLSPEDLERYSQQYVHIQAITQLYEQEPDNFSKLIDLLQQMQACGQPPQEIVDEMAPELQQDADGQPQLPGGLGGLPGLAIPGMSRNSSDANCCIQ